MILDSSSKPSAVITMRGEATRNPEIETNPFYFPVDNIQTCSPEYLDVTVKKAHLVVRMLEHRLGQEQLLQVRGLTVELIFWRCLIDIVYFPRF